MCSRCLSIVQTIRPLVGKAKYRLGATLTEAPDFFDCSGLIQWAYEAVGIYIPRFTVSQVQRGIAIPLLEARAGDIIFTTGSCYNFRPPHMPEGVGHAGIMTNDQTTICALWGIGVVEISTDELLTKREFRAVRRIISLDAW
jgi:cell wall-associated NlpC family hydrolase